MENERFQLHNVAKTVEMAVSNSKMLQLERKTCRKNMKNRIQKKNEIKKKIIPTTCPDLFFIWDGGWGYIKFPKVTFKPQESPALSLYPPVLSSMTIGNP